MLVVVLLAAWRLGSGPVSIGFLTPYIDQALNDVHKGAFSVKFDDTILTWAGWERTLDIRVVNLHVDLPSGEAVAYVPEVSISLSANALLQGAVAPRSVELFGPSFKVVRQADGQFSLGVAESSPGSGDFMSSMLLAMLQEQDPDRPISYLRRVSIVAGDVTFEDHALGTTWHAPTADAAFTRTARGLKAELDLDLQAGDKLAAVSILGTYSPDNDRVDLGLSFEDIRPSSFAELSDKIDIIGALDMPVTGTITLSVEQGSRIEGFGFDLTGGEGYLAFPVPVAARMGVLPWAQRIHVNDLNISGRFDGAGRILDVHRLGLTMADGEIVYLPQPFDHEMPLKSLQTALRYDEASGRLDVSGFILDAGGPRLALDGTFANLKSISDTGRPEGIGVDIAASAINVPFADLASFWPRTLGIDARTWVMDGLIDGVADTASMSLKMHTSPDGPAQIDTLAGKIHASGVTVNYLPPMSHVVGGSATANFTDTRFDIDLEGGDGPDGIKVLGGRVSLYDLNLEDPLADIQLDVEGPVKAALKLIDAQPLEFASAIGIDPETAGGQVKGHVSLKFPLRHDLTTDHVIADVQAELKDAALKGAIFGRDMTDGVLTLSATSNELGLQGDALLGGVPVQLTWKHDFRTGAMFLDRYDVTGHIDDVLDLETLGVQVPPILSRYMRGGVEANVNLTALSDGREALSARIDLTEIDLAVPELGWVKESGVPATGLLELRLNKDVPTEIPKFALEAPDMTVMGTASFLPDGKLQRIDISKVRTGLTDVAASLTPMGEKRWEMVLRGESLDARNMWDEFMGTGKDAAAEQDEEPDPNALAIDAAVDVHTVVMHKNRVIEDLIGTVYRRRDMWSKMDVIGVVDNGEPIHVLLDADDKGLRYLSIQSDDAGSALYRMDLYDNMKGGKLDLKAAYTSPKKNAPLQGVVKITDFAMIDPPVFTKLIGIMSLTGVLDALQGDGLNFDIAEAPFVLHKGLLTLTQSRASGPSIGVTANGQVVMENRDLDLKGTVVPAYAINALLGKIPLIGELFTGTEKGGGLFAATYTMKGPEDHVDITVNPLSALAPGLLRDIFTGSGKEKELPVDVPAPPPAGQAQ